MKRREFIGASAALLAACAAPKAVAESPETKRTKREEAAPPRRGRADDVSNSWEAVREQFDLSGDVIHMAGMLLASHPRPVRDAIERHRKRLDENPVEHLYAHWAREPHDLSDDGEFGAAQAAARYLETDPGLFALTDSTTMGLAMVYNGLKISEGQEVLTAHWNHWATSGSLRYRAAKTGFSVRNVALWDDPPSATPGEIVDRLEKALTPKTRLVAATWVHSVSGVKLPIGQMAEVIDRANRGREESDRIIFVVDGVHGFGVDDVTIADFGCDFFIAGCHKWLFGPRGTGLVWGAPDAWDHLEPTVPTFSVPRDDTPGRLHTPGGFHSFEHRWALPAAFEFHEAIGKARVEARISEFAQTTIDGLAAMDHVQLRTPNREDLTAGIVTFTVPGKTTSQVEDHLREHGIIASHTPERDPIPRLSPGLLNSPAEIDATLAALRGLVGS